MAFQRLKELEDEMKKCFRCSLCKMVPLPVALHPDYTDCCPANREFHFHGYSGSGKSIMALSLVDGRITVDEALANITFACTACGYCDVACKFIMDAERHLINMTLREHIVEEGLGPAVHREMIQNLKENGHPKGKRADVSPLPAAQWGVASLPRERADVLLFGGAPPQDNEALAVVEKLAKLLVHGGLKVGVLTEPEPHSGLFAYWTGYRDVFTTIARDVTALIDGLGVGTVVVASGADLGMLRSKYPEYAKPLRTKVVHATEILAELIKKRRLRLKNTVARKVTYHDPCYLGRQSEPPVQWHGQVKMSHGCMTYTDPPKPVNRGTEGVYDPPREILKAIPGLEFVEMHRIREYAFCCGGGGGVPSAYPGLAKSAVDSRVQEARDVGAQGIVTACHQCRRSLAFAGEPLPVYDIVDLVYESAGLGK